MNQVLEDYLWHFCSYYQFKRVIILDIAEFSIKNLDSSSLGTSPFFFANRSRPKFSIITENSGIQALDDFMIDLQEIQEKAIECLTQAKPFIKTHIDTRLLNIRQEIWSYFIVNLSKARESTQNWITGISDLSKCSRWLGRTQSSWI
jgi:hypothetical protein